MSVAEFIHSDAAQLLETEGVAAECLDPRNEQVVAREVNVYIDDSLLEQEQGHDGLAQGEEQAILYPTGSDKGLPDLRPDWVFRILSPDGEAEEELVVRRVRNGRHPIGIAICVRRERTEISHGVRIDR